MNDNGEVTDIYTYDAFGNLLDKTGTTVNNYLYCGEQFDSATGLYYLRARYMNPTTGTFITQDTYAGTIFDPTSLHKYLYANANPVMNVDPSGYNSIAESNAAMAISGILDNAASTASSFALNFYWHFRAAVPTIMMAVTGMATYLSNSSALLDMCAQLASGDITVAELQQEILNTFTNIQQTIWDHIYEATNRSHGSSSNGSSSGGNNSAGSSMPEPPDPNKLNHIFGKAQHNLQNFLNSFQGNQAEAYRAVEEEAQKYVTQNHINGVIDSTNQITINVSGYNITFRGYVDNGVLKLGTFFII